MSITIKAFGGKTVTRAPKGGFAHPVNGRSYKGGQFCPLYSVSGGSEEAAPLVALVGSPRQVEWAERIRPERIRAAEEAVGGVLAQAESRCFGGILGGVEQRAPLSAESRAEILAAIEATLASLKGESSAAWWIDHREDRKPAAYSMLKGFEADGLVPSYVAQVKSLRAATTAGARIA